MERNQYRKEKWRCLFSLFPATTTRATTKVFSYWSNDSSQYGNINFVGVLQNIMIMVSFPKPTTETCWNFLGKHRPMGRALPSALSSAQARAHKMRAPAVRTWRWSSWGKGVTQRKRLPGLKCGVNPAKDQLDQTGWYLGRTAFEPLPSSIWGRQCWALSKASLKKLHHLSWFKHPRKPMIRLQSENEEAVTYWWVIVFLYTRFRTSQAMQQRPWPQWQLLSRLMTMPRGYIERLVDLGCIV